MAPNKTHSSSPRAVVTKPNKTKQQKEKPAPVKQPVQVSHSHVSHKTAQSTAYAEFRSSSGAGTDTSHKEVIVDMTDYGDVVGNAWTAVGYQLATLPGFFAGSAVRLLSCIIDVMPPAMTANTATNNVDVLAGVRMNNEGGVLNSPSLCAGKETFIPPTNDPRWIKVMHANLSQLTHSGFMASSNAAGVVEVGRVFFMVPDSGLNSAATTLQARIRLRYAVSLPLRTTVTVALSPGLATSDTVPPFDAPVVGATIFPKVVGMQNAL